MKAGTGEIVVNTPGGAAADCFLKERSFTAAQGMRLVINRVNEENRGVFRAFMENRGNRLSAALEKSSPYYF